MKVVVIDLECGNIGSLSSALTYLGAEHVITSSASALDSATHVILPGVGAFDAAMQAMERLSLIEPLTRYSADRSRPLFGVCLGMQLLFEGSEEGRRPGLGVMQGRSVRLGSDVRSRWKVPHVGFSSVYGFNQTGLFSEFGQSAHFYFTHSYAIPALDDEANIGLCDHAQPFVAAFQRANVCGAQFHPEKSQSQGLRAISNFLELSSSRV